MKIVLRIIAAIFLIMGLWWQYYVVQINGSATSLDQQGVAAIYQVSAVLCFGFTFILVGLSSLLKN